MKRPTRSSARAIEPNDFRTRIFDRLLLAGVILLYVVLVVRRLGVPAPGYDESMYMPPVLRILQGAGARYRWRWPLMVMTYVGCPMSYFMAPFVAVWGVGVATLRLPAIGVALASVLVLLYLVSRIFPRLPLWAPAAACLLNSTFLIGSRTGLLGDISIHWLLLSLVLLCLWKWSLDRRPLYVFLAFFFAGFGVYAKILFVWYAFAAVLVAAAVSRRDARSARARLAGLGALGLFLGALPLVIYNALTGWPTADVVFRHWANPNPGFDSNLSLFSNLATRARGLLVLFDGRFALGPDRARVASGTAFLLLFASVFLLFHEKKQRAALAAAGLFLAAFFVGSTFSISTRAPYHLFAMIPLMLVLSGAALAKLAPNRLLLLTACALLTAPQLRHFGASMKNDAQATDERSFAALQSLSDYLTTADVRPVAIDWGLTHPLFVASGGKLDLDEDSDAHPSSLRPGSTAICFWSPTITMDVLQGCGRLLRDRSFTLGEVRKFPDEPAAPVYAAIPVLGVR